MRYSFSSKRAMVFVLVNHLLVRVTLFYSQIVECQHAVFAGSRLLDCTYNGILTSRYRLQYDLYLYRFLIEVHPRKSVKTYKNNASVQEFD